MPTTASTPPARHALVVLARAPQRGRVKTRLAATIGADAALAAYRALGTRVIDAVAPRPAWRTVVAFTPADAREPTARWLGDAAAYAPQADGDLGARMAAAIEREGAAGATRVAVIGTDCPDVDARVVATAFARLDDADAVFGPALDGGYYLVALHTPLGRARTLFEQVPWSAADTLAVTLRRAEVAGLRVALLDPLRDVDTADDLRAWQAGEADR